jgi:hypothetical protein
MEGKPVTAAIVGIEKRLRIAGVRLIVGLLVEAICLQWARPIAYILLVVVGGLLYCCGIVGYLYSLVSASEANPDRQSESNGDTSENWVSTSVNRDAKHRSKTALDALFLPNSVALIGATERPGTVGRTILGNLQHPSFKGKVCAVNSRHSEICGLTAYPSIGEVPEKG